MLGNMLLARNVSKHCLLWGKSAHESAARRSILTAQKTGHEVEASFKKTERKITEEGRCRRRREIV